MRLIDVDIILRWILRFLKFYKRKKQLATAAAFFHAFSVTSEVYYNGWALPWTSLSFPPRREFLQCGRTSHAGVPPMRAYLPCGRPSSSHGGVTYIRRPSHSGFASHRRLYHAGIPPTRASLPCGRPSHAGVPPMRVSLPRGSPPTREPSLLRRFSQVVSLPHLLLSHVVSLSLLSLIKCLEFQLI